jgi:hypothetical protein
VLRRLLIVLGVAAMSACATTAARPAASGGGDRFETEQNRYRLGQAPDWLDASRVVSHDPFLREDGADNQIHILRSTLGGKRRVCLTCGLEGPHQVPVVKPGARWILFHSTGGISSGLRAFSICPPASTTC